MNRKTMKQIIEKLQKDSLVNVSKDVKLYGSFREHNTTDRVVNYVAYPETYRAQVADVWDGNKVIIRYLREFFRRQGRLTERCAVKIIQEVANVLKYENNLLEIQAPINICGDIHGQYFDLLSVFEAGGGEVPKKRYLFLGDYVDRGAFSCEVILYLFALKINFPTSIFLLRGNHETRQMTRHYSFKKECLIKYSLFVYDEFMKAFDCLPLAALVAGRFFCCHAGIGPDLKNVRDVNNIDRFREVPLTGLFCDLVWSDPAPRYNQSDTIPEFTNNTTRKVSCYYSYRACCNFLRNNRLSSLIRAHTMLPDGYETFRVTERNYPSILSVFSAPNYVGAYDNKAAILEFDGKAVTAIQFDAVSQPYSLPKLMNGISFSLPFIVAKVSEIFYAVLKRCTQSDGRDFSCDIGRDYELRRKINAFGRAVQMSFQIVDFYTTLMSSPIDPPTDGLLPRKFNAFEGFTDEPSVAELMDGPEKCYA